MTVVDLPYLDKRYTKKGVPKWFFRHPLVPRTRIHGQPGEARFQRVYAPLLAQVLGEIEAEKQRTDEGSIRSLVDLYRKSDEWNQLADETRGDYGRELDRLCRMAGDLSYARLTPEGVLNMRSRVKADTVESRKAAIAARAEKDAAEDAAWAAKVAKLSAAGQPLPERAKAKRRKPKPVTNSTGARTADFFKSVLSALFSWAIEYRKVSVNPAIGIRKMHKGKNVESRVPWTEHQIRFTIQHGPRGVADGVIIGAQTGQRLEDVVLMGKSHCVGPDVRVKQLKTGNRVDIPATGPLIDLIARRRRSNVEDDVDALVLRPDGQAYNDRLFAGHLRDWLDAQGWFEISFHGLRYSAAGRLNEAGCSVATISSIIGHSTYQMGMKYASAREGAAQAAIALEAAAMADEA